MMLSSCAALFPTRFLDEILDLIESVSEGFYFLLFHVNILVYQCQINRILFLYDLYHFRLCFKFQCTAL